ncbi:MAG: hypothetical protein QXE79_00050 [Candidatus Bathyarchaeia archaeon]
MAAPDTAPPLIEFPALCDVGVIYLSIFAAMLRETPIYIFCRFALNLEPFNSISSLTEYT